jgi:hypothetical protein
MMPIAATRMFSTQEPSEKLKNCRMQREEGRRREPIVDEEQRLDDSSYHDQAADSA